MFNSNLPDANLLKTVLQPLLEDFQYWFERSQSLLETNDLQFMEQDAQADLLARVKQARQEVAAAQALFKVTEGQVGVETSALMPWHNLVMECWQVAMRLRQERMSNPDV